MAEPIPGVLAPYVVGLRHVGTITEDCRATAYRVAGLIGGTVDVVAGGGTDFAFLRSEQVTLEFIEPVSEHFRDLLLRRPPGADRVCFTVRDLPGAVAAMEAAGARLGHVTPDGIVGTPTFAMAYFDPATTGGLLIELVEDLNA
jgi:methylmalonyl-CoA/ethylmalonyl-CoA epimerase